MPEGPEIETIRSTLEEKVRGRRISEVWRSPLAFRTPSKTDDFLFLIGDRINELTRVAKILMIETDQHRGLVIRFGMSGRMSFEPVSSERPKHTHLVIRFVDSDCELRFVDARRFGDVAPYKSEQERERLLFGIGPDGLTISDQQISELAKKIKRSQREIKVLLLDQGMVSGVGNIYACEALFLARILPTHRSSDLSLKQIARVLKASKDVMLKAVANKGTTFMSYVDGNGEKGGNQNHLAVFAKEGQPCPVCARPIKRIVQAGRSTFYCAHCQK